MLLKDLVVLLRALNEDIDKKVEVKEFYTMQIFIQIVRLEFSSNSLPSMAVSFWAWGPAV